MHEIFKISQFKLPPIYDHNLLIYNSSDIINNKFTVYGVNGKFFWTVFGTREEIVVEPLKSQVELRGDGPYKYLI